MPTDWNNRPILFDDPDMPGAAPYESGSEIECFDPYCGTPIGWVVKDWPTIENTYGEPTTRAGWVPYFEVPDERQFCEDCFAEMSSEVAPPQGERRAGQHIYKARLTIDVEVYSETPIDPAEAVAKMISRTRKSNAPQMLVAKTHLVDGMEVSISEDESGSVWLEYPRPFPERVG